MTTAQGDPARAAWPEGQPEQVREPHPAPGGGETREVDGLTPAADAVRSCSELPLGRHPPGGRDGTGRAVPWTWR
ncbi:hypothetical protein QJS66_17690 [Kocuria rhizophila]|nr:hypothetical protein QJS66_17690 [Kocuria rhizophila]